MIGWIAQNTLVALVLAVVAALGWRLYRRTPALGHGAWLLVLAVLLAPPLPIAPWKGPRDQAAEIAQSTLSASLDGPSARPGVTRAGRVQAAPRHMEAPLLPRAGRGEHSAAIRREPRGPEKAGVVSPAAEVAGEKARGLAKAARGLFGPAVRAAAELARAADDGEGFSAREVEGALSGPGEPGRGWAPDAGLATGPVEAGLAGPLVERQAPGPAETGAGDAPLAPSVAPAMASPGASQKRAVTARGFPWLVSFVGEALPWIWLAGSGFAAWHVGSRMVRFDCRLRAGRCQGDARLEGIVCAAAARLGVRAPRVWIVAGAGTPMVWALGRPRLIWPAGQAAPGVSTGDRAVIAHELAHLRRRDHWWAWVEIASIVVLWWHPLAHVARRRLRVYAELAADAWVVWAHPQERRAYADALIDTAARTRLVRPAPAALGVVDSRTRAFHRRLRMIMSSTTSRTVRPLVAAGALLLAAGLLPTWSGASASAPGASAMQRLEPGLDERLDGRIDGRILPHLRVRALEARAERASSSGETERAAELYRELAALRPDDARLRERLGRMRYDAEDWRGAYEGWSAAAELDPTDGKSAYNAACAAALLGERDRALNWLDRSLRAGFDMSPYIESDSDLDALRKGDRLAGLTALVKELASARRAGRRGENEGDRRAALEAYARAAEIASHSEEDLSNLAMVCYRAKEWSRAEAAFRRLADVSNDADVLYNRACVLALAGERARALDALEVAFRGGYGGFAHARIDDDLASIRTEPRFSEMLARLSRPERLRREAHVAMEFGDFSGAAARFREAAADGAATEGFRRSVAGELGLAELRAGNHREAARIFREQAASGDALTHALYNVACALALAGDEGDALAYLEASVESGWSDAKHMLTDSDLDALRDVPGFARLVIAAADRQIFDAIGASDWGEAETAGRAMLESDPTSGAGHLRVGLALMRRGSPDEAIRHFQAQAKSGSMTHIAHYNLACAHAHLNQRDLAFASLEEAAKAGFTDADHYRYDLDLRNLFEDPRFESFLSRIERGEFSKRGRAPTAASPGSSSHRHGGVGTAVVAPVHDHDADSEAHAGLAAPAAVSEGGTNRAGSGSGTGPAVAPARPSAPAPRNPRGSGGPG